MSKKIAVCVGKETVLSESIKTLLDKHNVEVEIVEDLNNLNSEKFKDAVCVNEGNLKDLNSDNFNPFNSNNVHTLINPYLQLADIDRHNYDDWRIFSFKQKEAVLVDIRTEPKIGRNEPCPCGSGKKNKHCCKKF